MKQNETEIQEKVNVPCEFTAISPWFINERFMKEILKEAKWIQETSQFRLDIEINETNFTKYLGLKSKGLQPDSFIRVEHIDEWTDDNDIILQTEKYFWPPLFSQGASRHGFLSSSQLKGIGRNKLICHDYPPYASGALDKENALLSLINEILLEKRGIKKINTYAVMSYKDYPGLCYIMRELSSMRLAQLFPAFMSFEKKEKIFGYIKEAWSKENILESISKHYLEIINKGVAFKSVAPDNLTIDGALIDYDALSFYKGKTPFHLEVRLDKDEFDQITDHSEPFGAMIDKFSEVMFYDSSLHRLRLILRIYAAVLSEIEKCNLDELILTCASELSWPSEVLKKVSYTEANYFPGLQFHHSNIKNEPIFDLLFIEETAFVHEVNEVYVTLGFKSERVNIKTAKLMTMFQESSVQAAQDNYKELSRLLDRYV